MTAYSNALLPSKNSSPNLRAHILLNRSAAYLELCNYEKSLDDANRAIQLDNGGGKGHFRAGTAYLALGNKSASLQSFLLFHAIEPTNTEAISVLHDVFGIATDPVSEMIRAMLKDFQAVDGTSGASLHAFCEIWAAKWQANNNEMINALDKQLTCTYNFWDALGIEDVKLHAMLDRILFEWLHDRCSREDSIDDRDHQQNVQQLKQMEGDNDNAKGNSISEEEGKGSGSVEGVEDEGKGAVLCRVTKLLSKACCRLSPSVVSWAHLACSIEMSQQLQLQTSPSSTTLPIWTKVLHLCEATPWNCCLVHMALGNRLWNKKMHPLARLHWHQALQLCQSHGNGEAVSSSSSSSSSSTFSPSLSAYLQSATVDDLHTHRPIEHLQVRLTLMLAESYQTQGPSHTVVTLPDEQAMAEQLAKQALLLVQKFLPSDLALHRRVWGTWGEILYANPGANIDEVSSCLRMALDGAVPCTPSEEARLAHWRRIESLCRAVGDLQTSACTDGSIPRMEELHDLSPCLSAESGTSNISLSTTNRSSDVPSSLSDLLSENALLYDNDPATPMPLFVNSL